MEREAEKRGLREDGNEERKTGGGGGGGGGEGGRRERGGGKREGLGESGELYSLYIKKI